MKSIILVSIFSGLLFKLAFAQNSNPEFTHNRPDKIFQYSVFAGLANKIYDGTITVEDIKKKGDLGLGTFNGLDGEMIIYEGEVYQWTASGELIITEENNLIPFAVTTFFEPDYAFTIESVTNYKELQNKIESKLPSENLAYAFKITAHFNSIKCGSAQKQTKPYSKTLGEALVNRPTFLNEKISGTMVGFWYPDYIGKINIPGFHLHFISDDKKHAGHVLDFSAEQIEIEIDYCDGFDIELPSTKAFEKANFDLSQEYNKK